MNLPDHLWIDICNYLDLTKIILLAKNYSCIKNHLPQIVKNILRNQFKCTNLHQLQLAFPIDGPLINILEKIDDIYIRVNIAVITYNSVLDSLTNFGDQYNQLGIMKELIEIKSDLILTMLQDCIDNCNLITDQKFFIKFHKFIFNDNALDLIINLIDEDAAEQLRIKIIEFAIKSSSSPLLTQDTVFTLYSLYAEQNMNSENVPEIMTIIDNLVNHPTGSVN